MNIMNLKEKDLRNINSTLKIEFSYMIKFWS